MTARRWFGCIWMAIGLALTALPATAQIDTPKPQRIVSSNLCADRLVLQLADRGNVVSVGRYATDPLASTVADAAAGIPVNEGTAEDIIGERPDIVILGTFNSRATASMLNALGVRTYLLPVAESIEATKNTIRGLAAALGVPERGERMIADMDARLAALPKPNHPVRAAVYQAGGWSAGKETMADDLFGRVGFTNLTAEAGVSGFGVLPLETLVAASPDLIVFESMGDGPPSVASELLHHPALARKNIKKVSVPMRLWACPDIALVDAAALIAGAAR
jgi:iron complex transport system substrate-binding protein